MAEITDEQIDAILVAADPAYLSARREYKPAWRSRMRKALAATSLSLIEAAAYERGQADMREKAAKVFDVLAEGHRKVSDMHRRGNYERGMALALHSAKIADDTAARIRTLPTGASV